MQNFQLLHNVHFYPRPPGGGRRCPSIARRQLRAISIHALRVEGDRQNVSVGVVHGDISIHALRVEGDVDSMSIVP